MHKKAKEQHSSIGQNGKGQRIGDGMPQGGLKEGKGGGVNSYTTARHI
jgi:hypothetical protein